MARRKKESAADALVELVAMLPWWAGVLLALVSYLWLHSVAGRPVAPATQVGQMGSMVAQTLWQTLAIFGQYLLPFLCLLGAGASAWKRHQRKFLVVDVAASSSADALSGMTWRQFETLVGEAFRLQSYHVVETGGGGPDGGIDLVLTKDREKFLVQCKQWKAFKVGVDVVRELYGVMAAKGATGGFVVTSGRFTEEAVNFASGRNVKLIDGPKLHGLIRQAQIGLDVSQARTAPAPSQAAPRPMSAASSPASAAAAASAARLARTPSCPICSKPMVMRTAKRGASAGNEFWGCTGYPACRGTRPVD